LRPCFAAGLQSKQTRDLLAGDENANALIASVSPVLNCSTIPVYGLRGQSIQSEP
jgi:hypothetical protein